MDFQNDVFLDHPADYTEMLAAAHWALASMGIEGACDYGCHSAKPTSITWALTGCRVVGVISVCLMCTTELTWSL